MLQGIVLLAMAVGTAGKGVYALANTEEVCLRRARAQGRASSGGPSADEMRRVRSAGTADIVVGLVAGIFANVLIGKMSTLQNDMRQPLRRGEPDAPRPWSWRRPRHASPPGPPGQPLPLLGHRTGCRATVLV